MPLANKCICLCHRMSKISNDIVVLFYRKGNDKIRKVTHYDVTEAQYEVLQRQKEKIKEQIRFSNFSKSQTREGVAD